MDTFTGQENAEMKELCSKNECELVIVQRNLTNKFQPLDITINQKAKKFIPHKFNTWYTDCVSNQLKSCAAIGKVKVPLKMSDLKPLRVHWIVETNNSLKQRKGLVINGFIKAGTTESVNSSNEVFARIENPFTAKRAL